MKYLALIFWLSSIQLSNLYAFNNFKDGDYHSIRVNSGEGISSLLSRYELSGDQRLTEEFFALNGLNTTSLLYQHKEYKLPIKLYNYNGKSIRSTIGINNWEKAIRIKEYNELLLKKGVRSTHFTQSRILWVLSTELDPNKEIETSESKIETMPVVHVSEKLEIRAIKDKIYGNKYASVDILDHTLKNKVYYIVSGHGGPDPGAMCTECSERLCEDEYAYDVSLRLARNLKQHGAIVELVIQDGNDGIRDKSILKCDSDERMADGAKLPLDHLSRLKQRTDYINKKYKEYKNKGIRDQVVLSLHIDSNSKSHEQDVFFCYYKESKSSRNIAIQLRDKFQEKYDYHQSNRGYKGHLHQRNFYVLRKTSPPAVLIELANIKNKFNHKRILQKENRQALANWLYEGLVESSNTNSSLLASTN